MEASTGVGRRTAGGATLLIASRLTTRLIDLGALLILARTLTPSDFGLTSIAMTLIYVTEAVFELPISQSLLRLDKIDQSHLSTAFTISLIRGLVLGIVQLTAAIPFALIYHDFRLIPLLLFLTIAPAARGAASPAMVHYARKIDFRRDIFLEITGKTVGFLASTSLAVATHSYWAIAVGTVTSPLIIMMLSYVLAPFRPRLSLQHWRSFVHFLGWASAAQALSAFNWQADKLILGRWTNRATLGSFSMASDLASVPDQVLVAPIVRPLMAGFVSIRNLPDRLLSAYQRASMVLLTISAPALVGVSLLADIIVPTFLGPKWAVTVPLLRLLAVAPIFSIWVAPLDPLAMAMSRTSIFFKQRLIELFVRSALLFFLISNYGIFGAAVARLVGNFIMMVISMFMVRQLIPLNPWRQLFAAWRVTLATAAMATLVFAGRSTIPMFGGVGVFVSIGLYAAIGAVSYTAILIGLWLASGRPEGPESFALQRARSMLRL